MRSETTTRLRTVLGAFCGTKADGKPQGPRLSVEFESICKFPTRSQSPTVQGMRCKNTGAVPGLSDLEVSSRSFRQLLST